MKVQSDHWTHPRSGEVAPGPAAEVIARLAELLWEREGCPQGRQIEFWLRAEAELKGTPAPDNHEPSR